MHVVPDLNTANFAAKLEKVRNWWNLGVALLVLWNRLNEIERIYTSTEDRLKLPMTISNVCIHMLIGVV